MIPKFRAWITEGNDMVYPQDDTNVEWTIDDLTGFIAPQENLGGGMWGMYDKYELMQSTGLRDKNGVEIYEGDILKSRDSYLAVYVVEWYKDKFMWVLRYQKDKNQYFPFYGITNTFLEDLEMLGNIYENLELLEDVE